MKKNMNPVKQLVAAFLAGLLVAGQCGIANAAAAASAGGNDPSNGATVKPREQYITQGHPVPLREKGAKTFEVYGTTSDKLVVDEGGVAPTTGQLLSVEISSAPTAGAGGSCFVLVADSGTAAGITEQTYGVSIVPPLVSSGTWTSLYREYTVPKQFHFGLVVFVSDAHCRATITWARNGRQD